MTDKRMRGFNLGGWFSQVDCIEEKNPSGFPGLLSHMDTFLGPQDFARIAEWGFDHVRLPVDYFNVFDPVTLVAQESVLRRLEHSIRDICNAGLSVILDLHKCPGHDFHDATQRAQSFFTDPLARAQSKHVWDVLAERFGWTAGVMLEILNEPVAPDAAIWNSVKDELFRHIRARAPRATIVVGSNKWNNPTEFRDLRPLDDDNVLYSFHYYLPVVFTHQKAPWIGGERYGVFHQDRRYPGTYEVEHGYAGRLPLDVGRWDRDRMEHSIEDALNFRHHYGVPVACNEFGVYVGGADRDSQMRWMGDFLGILKEHDIGFSYWNYKNLDFGVVSEGESLHDHLPQYANGERTDYGLVELMRNN